MRLVVLAVAATCAALMSSAAFGQGIKPPVKPEPEICFFAGKQYTEGAFLCYSKTVRFTCTGAGKWRVQDEGDKPITSCAAAPY